MREFYQLLKESVESGHFLKFLVESFHKGQYRKKWKTIFWTGALVTTFLTTYFLILPALTVEKQTTNEAGIVLSEKESSSKATQTTDKDQVKESTEKSKSSSISESKSSEEKSTSQSQATSSKAKTEEAPSYQDGAIRYRGTDYTIDVTIPKEAKVSDKVQLKVKELTESTKDYDQYKQKVSDKLDNQPIKTIRLFDITLVVDGKEVEPEAEVKVEINYDQKLEAKPEQMKVVHFKEDGELEVLDSKKTDETKQSESEVAFKTSSFSVYAIVQENHDVPIATYTFQNADGSTYTFLTSSGKSTDVQKIKDGEALKGVGIPIIKEHEHFNGWYIYDEASGRLIKKISFDEPIHVTESKSYIVRPSMGPISYVTLYESADGTTTLQKLQVPMENGEGTVDLSSYKAQVTNATDVFAGWSTTQDGTVISLSELKNYKITGDVYLYPVFKQGKKVEFYSEGGSYIAPKLVLSGTSASTIQPTDPTREGYTFVGWYTSPTGGSAYNFNQTITKDTKLYARWSTAKAAYSVVYWQQSATDSINATADQKTYEYAGQSDPRTGAVGAYATLTSSDTSNSRYPGFVYTNKKGDVKKTIAADGSTILNVYFDRQVITMQFGYYSGNYYYAQYTYKGLYGTSLEANNYRWRSEKTWNYYSSDGEIIGMSYLGEFILPDDTYPFSGYEANTYIRFFPGSDVTSEIYFYKENLNGSYDNQPDDTGTSSYKDIFTFTEKYDGFTVDSYRRGYYRYNYNTGTNTWYYYDNNWVRVNVGATTSVYANNGYMNMDVRYRRKSFYLRYLDPVNDQPLRGFTAASLKYEESLHDSQPTTNPVPTMPGYRWDGKWYKDKNRQEEFNWDITMPSHDVKVYPGWEKIKYKVKIETDHGEISDTEATYFNAYYGEKIIEYKDISRDYVEDSSGTYYFRYDTEGSTGDQRRSRYTQDPNEPNVDTSKKYRQEEDAYKLIGWYKVLSDGTLRPYNFNESVTEDITIRAVWRKVGEYRVVYSTQGVDQSGNSLVVDGSRIEGSDPPIDSQKYDDGSNSSMLKRLTIPQGYRFRGWWYKGKAYNPYDGFEIDSTLANSNKEIIIYPVFIPIDNINLEDTSITFDANGGTIDVTAADGTVTSKIQEKIEHVELNTVYTTRTDAVTKKTGYTLLGWNHDKEKADQGSIEFLPNIQVGVDNKPEKDNILYAVWAPKLYKVTVTKKVVGGEADRKKVFSFMPNSALAEDNFGLRHNETKTFENIPYGTEIRIDEQDYDDFDKEETIVVKNRADGQPDTTMTTSEVSSMVVEGDVDVLYTNTKNSQIFFLKKVDVENLKKTLKGAKFNFYQADTDGSKEPTPIFENIESDDDGVLTLEGDHRFVLPVGDYYLTEIQAPDGYNLAKNDIKISVTTAGVSVIQDGNAAPSTVIHPSEDLALYEFSITNSSGTALPSTGGVGHYVFELAGLGLVLSSALFLYKYKQK